MYVPYRGGGLSASSAAFCGRETSASASSGRRRRPAGVDALENARLVEETSGSQPQRASSSPPCRTSCGRAQRHHGHRHARRRPGGATRGHPRQDPWLEPRAARHDQATQRQPARRRKANRSSSACRCLPLDGLASDFAASPPGRDAAKSAPPITIQTDAQAAHGAEESSRQRVEVHAGEVVIGCVETAGLRVHRPRYGVASRRPNSR